MSGSSSQNEDLINRIARAFRHVERPQITLRVARAVDDHQWDDLPKRRSLDGHYRDWTQIPEEDMAKFKDVWLWLCPIGVRFYLPAYMTDSLRSSRRLIDEVWMLFAFGGESFNETSITVLDGPQKRVLYEFFISAFECVKDDYTRDWWNHPWDPAWDVDMEKQHVWDTFGRAFTFLRNQAAQ